MLATLHMEGKLVNAALVSAGIYYKGLCGVMALASPTINKIER